MPLHERDAHQVYLTRKTHLSVHLGARHCDSPPAMHASRLVELAVSATNFHRAMMNEFVGAEFWRADEFWVLSRARVNEWSRLMKQCERSRSQQFQSRLFWKTTEPILEEILLAEVSTRVWCATLSIIDETRFHGELAPIARSVFVANLEVRRRALRLLLFARGLSGVSATSTNLLRRDCELWTDGLLSQLSSIRIAQQFGFDRRRIQRFSAMNSRQGCDRPAWTARSPVTLSSLQSVAIQYGLAVREMRNVVCPELNAELATNLLGCLPTNGFTGCGEPSLTWTADSFCSDMLSISVLEDLCGNSTRPRYDVPGGLMDRR